MTNMIRLNERLRGKKKDPSYPVVAKTYEEFKVKVVAMYSEHKIVFTKLKARIEPFSPYRLKLHWEKS